MAVFSRIFRTPTSSFLYDFRVVRQSKGYLPFFNTTGLTLLELVMVVAILGTLSAISIPMYQSYYEKLDESNCIADIGKISGLIIAYNLEYMEYPASLADVGADNLKDPWGRSFEYLRISDSIPGKRRKDHFMVPVNTDFDLYSKGEDGKSQTPFTAKASRDDIVRAYDGEYIGKVSDM